MEEEVAVAATPAAAGTAADPAAQNVRRLLARLRRRWQAHAPASPMSLCEELEPGVTVAAFCTDLLLAQRKRRSAGAAPPSATR